MSQLPVSLFGLSEGQFLESIGGWKVGSVCGPLLLFLRFSEGRAGKRAQKTGPTFLQGLVVANFEPFAISATWGAQASAIWGWSNWLLAEAARGGKAALLLNLDETSVHLAFTHCGGNIMMPNPTKAWMRSARQPATRAEQRSYFTSTAPTTVEQKTSEAM